MARNGQIYFFSVVNNLGIKLPPVNYKPIMNLPQTKKQQTLKMQSLYPQTAVTRRSETLVVSIQQLKLLRIQD